MRLLCVLGVLVLATTAAASAQAGRPTRDADLTGRWTLTTSADGPHGAITMPLTLKQAGRTISGALTTPGGGDVALEGTFEAGTLTLADPEGQRVTMNARLKADGTLEGYTSTERGDMTWTASRVKAAEKK